MMQPAIRSQAKEQALYYAMLGELDIRESAIAFDLLNSTDLSRHSVFYLYRGVRIHKIRRSPS